MSEGEFKHFRKTVMIDGKWRFIEVNLQTLIVYIDGEKVKQ